jgi:FkbM family methyltransferase
MIPNTMESTRTLHNYRINEIALAAYDEADSGAVHGVIVELAHDMYGLERIPFEPGDVVIDIGAHVGLVSIYLAKRWPFLRIHAFEPHPTNYQNCVDNLRLNDVSNVHLSRMAVTADRRPVILRSLRSNTGGATAVYDMPGADSAPAAESLTLDDIFATTLALGQRCRLLKIDCEGSEYEILPSPVLERVDFLAGEFHDDAIDNGSNVKAGPGPSPGRAQALIERCAQYFQSDRMRVICCPKRD